MTRYHPRGVVFPIHEDVRIWIDGEPQATSRIRLPMIYGSELPPPLWDNEGFEDVEIEVEHRPYLALEGIP